MNTWGVIAGLALASYAFRISGPLIVRHTIPDPVDRILRYLAPAVLGGLIAVGMFTNGQSLEIDERVFGFGAAVLAAILRLPPLVIIIGAALVTAAARLL